MIPFIERFQTGIVGLVGFLGVVLTLLVNAWLERRSRLEQIAYETNKLRTALCEELRLLRGAYRDRADLLQRAVADMTPEILIPLDKMTDVYRSNLGHLGLLTADEIARIISAYGRAEQIPGKFQIIGRRGGDVPPGFVLIQRQYFAATQQLHERMLAPIDDAIAVLSTAHQE